MNHSSTFLSAMLVCIFDFFSQDVSVYTYSICLISSTCICLSSHAMCLHYPQLSAVVTVADPREGPWLPPGPVKISHIKMATEGDCLDFMFLAPPPPYSAAGSTIGSCAFFIFLTARDCVYIVTYFLCSVCCSSRCVSHRRGFI